MDPKKVAIPSVYPTTAPLSMCIRSGHLVFVSGIGGWYANRRAEPGDIKVQIHSALTDMKTCLRKWHLHGKCIEGAYDCG